MEIKNVFVMGAGVMGSGIAQVVAQAGYKVILEDVSEEFLKRALANIEKGLGRMVKKGDMSEQDKANIKSRISATTDLTNAKDADLVIEAIPEDLELN